MQHAKRMVLVDEKLLDNNPILRHFEQKQDLSWNQPTEQTVKTSISRRLKDALNEPTVRDDVKAKEYSHDLNRFLHAKSKIEEQPRFLNLKPEVPPEKQKSPKSKLVVIRRASVRVIKKPKRYADVE